MTPNFMVALAALAMMALVCRAFWPLVRIEGLGMFARSMIWGVVLVAASVVLRSTYWDVIQLLAADRWADLRRVLGGQSFSALFNLIVLAAGYFFLRARLALVPEGERDRWRWWTVWAHPGERCLIDWRRAPARQSKGKTDV